MKTLLITILILGSIFASCEVPDAPSAVKTKVEHRDAIKPLRDWKFWSANAVHISGAVADNEFSYSCTQRGTCYELNTFVCGGCLKPTRAQLYKKDLILIPAVTGVSYLSGYEAATLGKSRWRFLFKGIEYGFPIAFGAWRWQAASNGARY